MARIPICKADDVSVGNVIRVSAPGLNLAVYHVGDKFYVTDDSCTHGPGSLSEGYLEGEVIECNFHQGKFNVRTGEVVLPPCMIPIKTYNAVLEDGVVHIDI
jgi:nitrite reductase/ring-hydroxylating ferredoxin subunit